MAQVTTKAGKQGTRGEKTIIKENVETLDFYRNITLLIVVNRHICSGVHLTSHVFFILFRTTRYVGNVIDW